MTHKAQEIEDLKVIQRELKLEISKLKSKRPTYLIGFLFMIILAIYFLESSLYHYFGNSQNFIKFGFLVFVIISLIYIYANKYKVSKKEKELKSVSAKLYQLMKLNQDE